ncbi:MAG TPA: tRNA preQ1(34) S-adenosylmethionine ribosyltransferase-isomerase QueA [Acidimicrobiales bacterium]
MDLDLFAYDLPERAVAQRPAEPRDAARLLVDRGPKAPPEHRIVRDLPSLVGPGDLLVVNTTRVLPARLRLRKETGGQAEVLVLERTGPGTWEALVRPGRRLPPGTVLVAGDDLAVEVGEPVADDGRRLVRLLLGGTAGGDAANGDGGNGDGEQSSLRAELAALDRYGAVPLPPYITAPLDDPERYQTVYAERPASVAAPTAGLHLTPAVLDACRAAGARVEPVELIVGLGTFRPIATPRVEDHRMHAERYRVPPATWEACAAASRVLAVGTTTVRALEAAAVTGELSGRTDLFIRRPWRWRVVDALLTNFHMPRSSLLVLVDALVGPRWRQLYAEALAEGYRFLSFGDAMLLERDDEVASRAEPEEPA